MSNIVRDTIANLTNEPGLSSLQRMRERRKSIARAMETLVHTAGAESRNLRQSESRDFDLGRVELAQIDARINELEEIEAGEALVAETRRITDTSGPQTSGIFAESRGGTYHPGPDSPSYFKDLIYSQRGDANAADRLRRNNQEMLGRETRALGNTGGTGGSGGDFAPPAYLTDQFIKLARPGRVTADLFHHEQLPAGVSSINLPRVLTGTTTAVQSTQNTALAQTDATTGLLTSSISTIGGKQVVSQQLLDQSGIPFDQVILQDLAADYAKQLGTMVLTGSGTSGALKGYLTATSTNVVTWTTGSPSAPGFYAQLAKLQGQINSTRYAAPDTVVMSPRRWAWLASSTDTQNRPLVLPTAGGFNSMATAGGGAAAGHVGYVLGMECYTDPNIPINLGTGTNQDVVMMFVRDDVWLWESPLRAEAFQQPYSDSLSVLLRVYAYSAMVPDRYPASLGQISGTGLVTPTFTS